MSDKKKEEAKINPLLETRQLMISGQIEMEMAKNIIEQLLLLDSKSHDKITIYINSPGGEVNSGFAIFDTIRYIKSEVVIIGCGLVASAAALILLAVEKKNRLAFPHSQYLIHQPLSGRQGVATDILIHAKEVEKLKLAINMIIAKETNKSLEEVASHTERDYWLTAPEAVEYNLVDKII